MIDLYEKKRGNMFPPALMGLFLRNYAWMSWYLFTKKSVCGILTSTDANLGGVRHGFTGTDGKQRDDF